MTNVRKKKIGISFFPAPTLRNQKAEKLVKTSSFLIIYVLFILQKSARNPYVDIFVAIVTVPTLIFLALLLDANIQENFEGPHETRSSFIVLIFGFGFLVLSLLICGCIVHKMGLCRWNQRQYMDAERNEARRSFGNISDCIHVIDLPPSYDAVTHDCIKHDTPRLSSNLNQPPNYETACNIEKQSQHNGQLPQVQHI